MRRFTILVATLAATALIHVLTSGPFTCADFFAGHAAGGYAYDIGYGGLDKARLRLQAAVPYEERGPLTPGIEYYAFR